MNAQLRATGGPQLVPARAMPQGELLAEFERNGYVVAPRLIGAPLLQALQTQAAADRAARRGPAEYEADLGYPGAPSSREADGGQTVRRLLRAYERGGAYQRWAHDESMTGILATLLSDDHVSLTQAHHNCVMTKAPGYSSDTGWHQDVRYWRFEPPELINVWLALTPETASNGALRVIPGSHRWDLGDDCFDAEKFLLIERVRHSHDIIQLQLEPGDAVFFSAALFHSASRNLTSSAKVSLVYSFHGSRTVPITGTRSSSMPEVVVRQAPPRATSRSANPELS